MGVALIIIDGAGLDEPRDGNAVTADTLPVLFDAMRSHGFATLEASGTPLGLDEGQAGNSEIGHLTIGAGFVVPSNLARIRAAAQSGEWAAHGAWDGLARAASLHIVGLVSDAGTHGHWTTLVEAARIAQARGCRRIVVDAILDGVDSPSGSAPALLARLREALSAIPGTRLGLVMGRRWFCDRTGALETTRVFARAVASEDIPAFDDARLAEHLREAGEAAFPAHRVEPGTALAAGAPVLIAQNRADRAVQAARVLGETNPLHALIELEDAVSPERVFFPTRALGQGLAFELRARGLRSVRVAETCKFPHVTYFLNGFNRGLEGEEICIPSDSARDLADNPAMAIDAVADRVVAAIAGGSTDLVVANLANLDQIGHLGSFPLACAAAEHVDRALARIRDACAQAGFTLIVTSDHGNADCVVDRDGRPFGSHTARPVPFTVLPAPGRSVSWTQRTGTIARIAPSVLVALGIEPPDYMEGSLIGLA